MYSQADLAFLADLSDNANNTSDWVKANRPRYDALIASQRAFIESVGAAMSDLPDFHAVPKTNKSMMRMNRDTRFSKDKRPYKDHNDSWFWRGPNKKGSAGYWFRVTGSMAGIGVGMHGMDKDQLNSFRAAVADDGAGEQLVSILQALRDDGYDVNGEATKRVPRGFDKDHVRADLLKHKGLFAFKDFAPPPAELFTDNAGEWAAKRYRTLQPLQEWFASVL